MTKTISNVRVHADKAVKDGPFGLVAAEIDGVWYWVGRVEFAHCSVGRLTRLHTRGNADNDGKPFTYSETHDVWDSVFCAGTQPGGHRMNPVFLWTLAEVLGCELAPELTRWPTGVRRNPDGYFEPVFEPVEAAA